MDIKEMYKKWTSYSLALRIVCGLAIGLVLGLLIPGLPYIRLLGTAFIAALTAVAPVLIFLIIVTSLISRSERIGGRMKYVIILYFLSCIVATVVATVLYYIDPVTVTLPAVEDGGSVTSFEEFLEQIILSILVNPFSALAEANYLGILFWAILIGVFMRPFASITTVEICKDGTDLLLKLISIFIQFAPIGMIGLVYNSVTEYGIQVFGEYGALIAVIVAAMALVMFVFNPLIVYIFGRKNPYPLLFRCIKDSAVTAFFTRSSAANIPVNLDLCSKLGLDKQFYTTSIPLGSAINMCGSAATITILALAAANSVGIDILIGEAIVLCFICVLCACGTSGVAGGSILLIPMACSILGVPGDAAVAMMSIGFVIGVVTDSCGTALNSSSDVLFTATVDGMGIDDESQA